MLALNASDILIIIFWNYKFTEMNTFLNESPLLLGIALQWIVWKMYCLRHQACEFIMQYEFLAEACSSEFIRLLKSCKNEMLFLQNTFEYSGKLILLYWAVILIMH